MGARVGLGARLDCGGEVRLGARRGLWRRSLDCVGKGWIGARLWFVGARLDLARGCELCRRGWVWRETWIVSARLGLERGFGLWGRDDGNAAL